WGPTRVVTKNNKVVGVEFKKCLSIIDETGRFNPKFDEDSKKIVPCDYVLLSVGQTFDYGNLLEGEGVNLAQRGTIEVNTITLQTSKEDIFAGGDVASGPRFAIDAIAAGKEAAISIHRFVQNGQSLVFGRDNHYYKVFDKTSLAEIEGYDGTQRQKIDHVDGKIAKKTFKDLRGTLTEEQIKKESARCLGCGATKADEYLCIGCGACTLKCKFGAISLERIYDVKGFEIEKLPKEVIKNSIKRKLKITANKVNPFTKTR
ncbi:MAG: FAD-dependent oxidoreductase, partial [Clostridium sp.]